MPTAEDVLRALEQVVDPELRQPIGELGMLKDVSVADNVAFVEIVLTVPGCPLKDSFRDQVEVVLAPLGLTRVELIFTAMDRQEREEPKARLLDTVQPREALSVDERTRVVAIVSGKGGVGKSTLTINLAAALSDQGVEVGLLDADVYGHAIPALAGLRQRPVVIDELIVPPTRRSVKLMSIGFFQDENKPVMWRGPLLHKTLERFVTQVHWGPLDILLLDMPPGTGDVAISLAQLLPKAEAIVVTTPQRVAAEVAVRAGLAARRLGLHVAGVIENMSYLAGDGRSLLGTGGGETLAAQLQVPFWGEVPLDPELAAASDRGEPLVWDDPDSETTVALRSLARRLVPGRRVRRRSEPDEFTRAAAPRPAHGKAL